MKYNIRKNWIDTYTFITKNPVVLFPFFIIAFFEGLSLELLYFSSRKPLALFFNPIVRKFFGEDFNHYPAHILIVPQLFYYLQMALYILLGAFLTAISVNIFKNIRSGLPVRADAMAKNAGKRYFSFFIYAVLVIGLVYVLRKADIFVFSKSVNFIFNHIRSISIDAKFYNLGLNLALFLTNVLIQTFLILAIPIIVIQNLPLGKALLKSAYMGLRNFLTVFTLLFLPFLIYQPLTILKSFSTIVADKTFPEIVILVYAVGIAVSAFLDCFVIVSLSGYLLDRGEGPKK